MFCNRQRLITRKKRLRLPLNDLAVIKKVTLHIEIQCVKKPISIRRVDSHCYIMNNKWCTLWQTSHLMLINMLYVYHWIFIKLCFMDNYINVDTWKEPSLYTWSSTFRRRKLYPWLFDQIPALFYLRDRYNCRIANC